MNTDDIKYLDLLSIFHYVVGGITALFACFPIIHLIMGIAFVTGVFDSAQQAPDAFFGWIFIIIACLFITAGWALAVCMFMTGTKLKRRQNRIFCTVIGGIECVFMPFGTVLGVFTIILLNKDSVKAMFDRRTAQVAEPSPVSQDT